MKSLTESEKSEVYDLVKKKVGFFSYLANALDKDDLAHEIFLKIIPYMERNYDPARSNLETFIEFKVKKMLIDLSDEYHYGSTYNKNKIKKIQNAKRELINSKKSVTWEEIRKKANLSQKQVDSIFFPLYLSPDHSDPLEHLVTSPSPSNLDSLIKEEDSLSLYSTMRRVLSPPQYNVIVKKYIEDKDYLLISQELGIPTSKVHSLSISAKRKLKKALSV